MTEDARAVTDWLEPEDEQDEDAQIEEYELTSSPNDFNISTIYSFIESGAVKIPGFQRNYVWDIKRASKLIESIIIGLPVPQIFLYEEARNKFLVIDGQQRLMSIYYFVKQRFPKPNKRSELRRIFDEQGKMPESVLHDDEYFDKFNLRLAEIAPGRPNKFNGRSYGGLDDYKMQFDLRTIRNIIVKQNAPQNDDSSIYEMFNRLNTGGINLTPQEIRASLYHSEFYNMLYRMNMSTEWRKLLGGPEPDLHMRDIEVLLRSFAMLLRSDEYGPSMAPFLNGFSKQAKGLSPQQVLQLQSVLSSFLVAARDVPENVFLTRTGKFSVNLFEAVFAAACRDTVRNGGTAIDPLDPAWITALKNDSEFAQYSEAQSTNKRNVLGRLARAKALRTELSSA